MYLESSARISECGRYRYLLHRVWASEGRLALYIMLNPSTADGGQDDPTIRSCVRLAIGLGYGGIEVVNLMAWRAAKPVDIPSKPSLAMGAGNPRAVEAAVRRCATVICAWGAHPYAAPLAPGILDVVKLCQKTPHCFGRTASGAPRHPLYIRSGTPLGVY